MSRFLIDTYDLLSEIALWLMFVSAVVGVECGLRGNRVRLATAAEKEAAKSSI